MQSKNIKWINTARALCLISVYLLHSEFYYGDAGFSYGYALTPFYVNTFFFISDYLLFKKYMKVPETISFPKKEYHKLIANVIFRLVIPTLVFSTLIYIPKMIFHGNPLSFGQYLHDVWGGTSYWFTSALSVAQILLAVLLLSQRSHMAFYVVACTLLSLLGIHLRGIFPSPFPWYYQTGMASTLLMSLGGIYLRYESRINKIISKPYVFGVAAFVYLYSIMITNPAHLQKTIPDIYMHLWEYLTILCSIICIITLSHLLPQVKWLEYIGKNSIIFYFFSGVMPALFGSIISLFAPDASYALTLTVTSIALLAATGINLIIQQYFPYLTDLRKILFPNQQALHKKSN